MNLSKAERKYRIKFIQECHYNKAEQRIFDEAVAAMSETYKRIYKSMRNGKIYLFMATITVKRAAKAMSNACVSVAQATRSFSAIGKALKESEVAQNEARQESYCTTEEISQSQKS